MNVYQNMCGVVEIASILFIKKIKKKLVFFSMVVKKHKNKGLESLVSYNKQFGLNEEKIRQIKGTMLVFDLQENTSMNPIYQAQDADKNSGI